MLRSTGWGLAVLSVALLGMADPARAADKTLSRESFTFGPLSPPSEGFGRGDLCTTRRGFLNAQKYRMGTCSPLRGPAGNGRPSTCRGQDSLTRVVHVRPPVASVGGVRPWGPLHDPKGVPECSEVPDGDLQSSPWPCWEWPTQHVPRTRLSHESRSRSAPCRLRRRGSAVGTSARPEGGS